ncbi:MAG: hypothetical protein ACI9J3_001329 [Parvicellaceae bacterium]|jgi:hypothetical protein
MKPISILVLALLICSNLISQNKYEKEFAAIDSTGKTLFTFNAKNAYAFKNGIAKVRKYVIQGNQAFYRYGGINEEGNMVIPAVWDKLRDFKSGVAFARKPGEKLYFLIGRNGLPVKMEQYEKPGYFFEGVAKFKKESKYGFIDSTGSVVVEPKYISVSYCCEGLICVNQNNETEEYEFVDRTGKRAFEKTFRQGGTSSFQNGLARVKVSGKTCLIDHQGEVAVKTSFSTVSGFGDSLLTVSQGKSFNDFGFADFDGNIVIPGPYYSAASFIGGYASVKNEDMKAGIINKKGEEVVPFKYDATYNEMKKEGRFGAYIGKDWFYFNEEGENFTEVNVRIIMASGAGKYSPYQDAKTEKWGYLNADGKIAIPAQFEQCKPFNENGIGIVQISE